MQREKIQHKKDQRNGKKQTGKDRDLGSCKNCGGAVCVCGGSAAGLLDPAFFVVIKGRAGGASGLVGKETVSEKEESRSVCSFIV